LGRRGCQIRTQRLPGSGAGGCQVRAREVARLGGTTPDGGQEEEALPGRVEEVLDLTGQRYERISSPGLWFRGTGASETRSRGEERRTRAGVTRGPAGGAGVGGAGAAAGGAGGAGTPGWFKV